ncbi:MAG: hypothetical protein QY325_06320 [Flavobacteriales bacterium]|mgnify:FL=1|jgi:hypothetical protein|nr:MAG: hypothetical protein QY325_06320 [Flavobacteriales bacterium]
MNRRLLLLIALLAALAAAAWWLSRRSSSSTLDTVLADFPIADTARVDRIFISDRKGRSVDLRRTPAGWTVNGTYMARQPEVTTALKTFLRVEVRSPVPKSMEEMTLRTMGASSTKVEIYTGGSKPEKIWIIGHATKDHFGTYMVLEKPGLGRSSAPFVMGMSGFTGVLNTRFPTLVDNWRSPRIFHFPDLHALASVEVEHMARPAASYRIENPDAGLPRLQDLKGRPLPMDTVLVQAALLPYKEFNYEYIERGMKPASRDSLLGVAPNFQVRVKARSGTEERMKLWYMPYVGEQGGFDTPRPLQDPLRMYALVQDTLLVVVQRQYTDVMTQPASAFLP